MSMCRMCKMTLLLLLIGICYSQDINAVMNPVLEMNFDIGSGLYGGERKLNDQSAMPTSFSIINSNEYYFALTLTKSIISVNQGEVVNLYQYKKLQANTGRLYFDRENYRLIHVYQTLKNNSIQVDIFTENLKIIKSRSIKLNKNIDLIGTYYNKKLYAYCYNTNSNIEMDDRSTYLYIYDLNTDSIQINNTPLLVNNSDIYEWYNPFFVCTDSLLIFTSHADSNTIITSQILINDNKVNKKVKTLCDCNFNEYADWIYPFYFDSEKQLLYEWQPSTYQLIKTNLINGESLISKSFDSQCEKYFHGKSYGIFDGGPCPTEIKIYEGNIYFMTSSNNKTIIFRINS